MYLAHHWVDFREFLISEFIWRENLCIDLSHLHRLILSAEPNINVWTSCWDGTIVIKAINIQQCQSIKSTNKNNNDLIRIILWPMFVGIYFIIRYHSSTYMAEYIKTLQSRALKSLPRVPLSWTIKNSGKFRLPHLLQSSWGVEAWTKFEQGGSKSHFT